MKSIAIILFLINGQPHVMDGFYPHDFGGEEACEQAVLNMDAYLKSIGYSTTYVLDCISNVKGVEIEALIDKLYAADKERNG